MTALRRGAIVAAIGIAPDARRAHRGKPTLRETDMLGLFVIIVVFGALWLGFALIGAVFKLLFGLIGSLFGLLGTMLGVVFGGVALMIAAPLLMLVLLPLWLPILLAVALVWAIVRAATPRPAPVAAR
jgi:hypothetical protein